MPVFHIHDPARGVVTPLDDKYRIRQILEPDELNEVQKTHRKIIPSPENYQHSDQEQSSRDNQAAANAYTETRDQSSENRITDLAQSVMSSPVISIPKSTTLYDAWKVMQQHGISHLVITDENNRLAGLLSEKNILPHLIGQPSMAADQTDVRLEQSIASTLTLDVFCQSQLISATPDTNLYELAQVMLENRLDGIVIIENNALQGIITYADIIKVLLKARQIEIFA